MTRKEPLYRLRFRDPSFLLPETVFWGQNLSHSIHRSRRCCRQEPHQLLALYGEQGESADQAILTVDVGTSSTKSALYFLGREPPLGPVFRHDHHSGTASTHHITQRVSDWYNGVVETFRNVLQYSPHVRVVAIAATGQMQDLIAVGDNRPPILRSDAILYSDCRAQTEASWLSEKLRRPVLATSMLPKLKLLPTPSSDGPPLYQILLGAADYITFKLSGDTASPFTDGTTVSTTGLSLAPEHRQYDEVLLHRAGLSSFLPYLPKILSRPQVVGTLCSSVAEHIGRKDLAGIDIVHAGGDAFSATVGAGCGKMGSGFYIYAGTSGWVAATRKSQHSLDCSDDLFRIGHAADENLNVLAAPVASIGASLHVACDTLLQCNVSDLDEMAMSSSFGASGVVYVPYVSGRRSPAPRDVTRGGLYGIGQHTNQGDVARAVVEGVVFSVAEAANQLPGLLMAERLLLAGGVSKCRLFADGIAAMIGDITVCHDEVGLLGAGALAAQAIGSTFTENSGNVCIGKDDISSTAADKKAWRTAFQRWKGTVEAMESLWDRETET